jgi:valyl-tRNA synthetase
VILEPEERKVKQLISTLNTLRNARDEAKKQTSKEKKVKFLKNKSEEEEKRNEKKKVGFSVLV